MKTKEKLLEEIEKTKDQLSKLENELKESEKFDYRSIKTFEDACNKLGINSKIPIDDNAYNFKYLAAMYKLPIIFEAINNGWEPDWDNANEDKYYPWFNMSSVSFGNSDYYYWYSGSDAGSRLCTYNKDFSDYIGKTFEDIYREAFLIKR